MLWSRLKTIARRLFRRNIVELELNDEIQAYLQRDIDEKVRQGFTTEEARRLASIEIEGAEQVKERLRERRSGAWIDSWLTDIRYALRMFAKYPSFTLIAILTIAIGVGSTTAVFSVVDRILFRNLPYPDEDRLVSIGMITPLDTNEFLFARDYGQWRVAQSPFESMTSFTAGSRPCDLSEDDPIRLSCASIESTFLPTLGIPPFIGRNFTAAEDRPNAPKVALLSYSLWRGRFAGDRTVLGRTISLDGQPVTVIAVLPSNFEMPSLVRPDILVPQALNAAALDLTNPNNWSPVRAFARLKPGVTVEQAAAAMTPLFQRSLEESLPAPKEQVRLQVRSIRDRQVHDSRAASWLLLGSVFCVLLIACVNVANLLLARGAARTREFAMRAILGASRIRLIRQTLTESLLLGLCGGAAGSAFAWSLLRVFILIAPNGILRLHDAEMDRRALTFALAISVFSGLLFSIAPALQLPASETLSGWRTVGAAHGRFRRSLIAAQISICLVLLTSSGLLLKTLWNYQHVALGIRTESVITASMTLSARLYNDPQKQFAFFEELDRKLHALPEAGSIAIADSFPFAGARVQPYSTIEAAGLPHLNTNTGGMVLVRAVTADYFAALDIPMLRGHGFQADENQNVIVLSDKLAKRLFPNADPIGRQIRHSEGPWQTVIGVAGNVKNGGLVYADDPEYYVPYSLDNVYRSFNVIWKTGEDERQAAAAIRGEIAALDPALPVDIQTLSQRVGKLSEGPRFNAALLGSFAALGVLLAAVGLYGVISFLVTQRTAEIGVRIALGATSGGILKWILSYAARWTLLGLLIGLAGSFAATRFVRSLLFKVSPNDFPTFVAAILFLLVVAFIAAWIPSRRAANINPVVALRQE